MSDIFTLEYVLMTPELGKELKSFRITNNKSAKDIVQKFDKASSYISKLEKGDIKKIKGDFLIELCNYIVGSNDGFGRFIEIVGKYSSEQSVETRTTILNMDELLYEYNIPEVFFHDINEYMHNHNISVQELANSINGNDDIADSDEYEQLPINQWVMLSDGRTAIKFDMPVSYLESLFDGKPKPQTIHRAVATVVLYNLYRLGNEEDAASKAYDKLDFYGMHPKRKTLSLTKKDLNALTESFKREWNIDFDKFIFNLQLSTLATKDYGAKRLKQICSNMDNDPGFYFAYMSLNLEPLKEKNKASKQDFLNELKALIDKYSQSKDSIELYD